MYGTGVNILNIPQKATPSFCSGDRLLLAESSHWAARILRGHVGLWRSPGNIWADVSELNDPLCVITNPEIVAGLVLLAYEIRLASRSRKEILETCNFDTGVRPIRA
jgi:hypothetical protein